MLISTTSSIEGKTIKEFRGVVFGEVINGVNFIRDFTAGISNVLGGRATEYEEELMDTRAEALNEMMKRAEKIYDGCFSSADAYRCMVDSICGCWYRYSAFIGLDGTKD